MKKDRETIVRILSKMLDSPDSHGIFSTSTAYTALEHYIEQERIQAIGCAHAACCVCLDRDNDPRTLEVPAFLVACLIDIGGAAK